MQKIEQRGLHELSLQSGGAVAFQIARWRRDRQRLRGLSGSRFPSSKQSHQKHEVSEIVNAALMQKNGL